MMTWSRRNVMQNFIVNFPFKIFIIKRLKCSLPLGTRIKLLSLKSTTLECLCSSTLDPSSETHGQLVGSIKCPWWKFTRSRRAPRHLLLPNQFQKRLNCPLLIGQKKRIPQRSPLLRSSFYGGRFLEESFRSNVKETTKIASFNTATRNKKALRWIFTADLPRWTSYATMAIDEENYVVWENIRVTRLLLFADWPEKLFSGQWEAGNSNGSWTENLVYQLFW